MSEAHAALRPYRHAISAGGVSKVTAVFRQAAVTQTLGIWGISHAADGDDPVKYESALSAARLLVIEQAPLCMPRIKKPGVHQYTLDLLNEHYEVNGERFRLGNLTPLQVRESVLETLSDQRQAINKQVRDIRRLLTRCKFDDRPLVDQL